MTKHNASTDFLLIGIAWNAAQNGNAFVMMPEHRGGQSGQSCWLLSTTTIAWKMDKHGSNSQHRQIHCSAALARTYHTACGLRMALSTRRPQRPTVPRCALTSAWRLGGRWAAARLP